MKGENILIWWLKPKNKVSILHKIHTIMADDDLLFDYMFLEHEDKEEENERLREENEDLRGELNKRKTSIANNEEDYDKARFFAEDVQSIAADCGVDMEISYEEADRALKQGYTPENYYEYKMSSLFNES